MNQHARIAFRFLVLLACLSSLASCSRSQVIGTVEKLPSFVDEAAPLVRKVEREGGAIKAIKKFTELAAQPSAREAEEILLKAAIKLSLAEQRVLLYSYMGALKAHGADTTNQTFDKLQELTDYQVAIEAQKLNISISQDKIKYISATAATALFAYYKGKKG